MPTLIARVKSRLFLHSSLPSLHPLDGAYASLQFGRSLDVEDLREYEHGDEVRDIDWKATARHGSPLVKRRRAHRRHTVLFAVDTGISMQALADDELSKRELSVLVVGAIGILAVRHGDDVSMLYGDSEQVRRRPPVHSEHGLESSLRAIDSAIASATVDSDRRGLLHTIVRSFTRRMIVVVITDENPVTDDEEQLVKRLRVQHDLLWVTVRDAVPILAQRTSAPRADVHSGWVVPDYLHGDAAIVQQLRAQREVEDRRRRTIFDRAMVTHAEIGSRAEAVRALLTMLSRRSRRHRA